MKFLVLLVCLGFAAADLNKRAAPLVDDAVLAFKEGMGETGSLRRALRMPEATELDEVEDDLKEELTKKLRGKLNELLENIRKSVEEKKGIAVALREIVKTIVEQLKDIKKDVGEDAKQRLREIAKEVKGKLKELIKKILGNMGKRNLDEEYDAMVRSKFRDLMEKIKAEILRNETISKIREYIKNFVTNNPAIQAFKEFILKLKETDFKQLIRDLFEHRRESRAVNEIWEKVKDFFGGLSKHLKENTAKLRQWFKDMIDKGLMKLKDKYITIKDICMEVISNAKDLHGEMAREALEFFRPYKEDLGSVWDQLQNLMKEQIGSF